jgi:hypothetical protein
MQVFNRRAKWLNLTRIIEMQKIDRNELAKSAIAGGCCKSAAKTTTVAAPAPAPVVNR